MGLLSDLFSLDVQSPVELISSVYQKSGKLDFLTYFTAGQCWQLSSTILWQWRLNARIWGEDIFLWDQDERDIFLWDQDEDIFLWDQDEDFYLWDQDEDFFLWDQDEDIFLWDQDEDIFSVRSTT